MASKSENVFRFDCPPDQLMPVLISEDFQIAREKAMGSLEARVEEKSRSDVRLVYDVHTVDYARGMTGIDRSKTENNRTVYEWDLAARKASWAYHGESNKMARVWGSIRLELEGSGSRLTNSFEVEIKVPLMGGKIEKMVLKEVAKSWPIYEKTIRTFLAK